MVKATRKKQVEKKAEKTLTAATAVEDEMILPVLDVQKEDNKFSCFDMDDSFNVVPIDEDIVYLENIFDESDKKTDDKKGWHEESDDKDRGSSDDEPLVTVSESNEDAYNLDLSLSAVANIIADANFTTGAHILESQDIWIADTGATSCVTKHTEGGMKHHQTSVQTCGFAGETIQPDCKMDIPVTYSDNNGTEKFDVVLGDVETYKKFHYNLFSVTKMLSKGYKLEGNRHSLTVWNKMRSIVFDIVVHAQNGALYCARFTRTLDESETANPVIQGEEGSSKVAKTILKVNIKQVHDCLGHLSKDATPKIAAQLGMELYGTTFQTCEACAIGKAQQQNIPKEALGEKATIFNGRAGHDLS